MPRVFGRGSRSQPAALVSDQPIPASTGIWCRQEMACSGKPCRQSANLTPVPCSSTSKRSPLASTNLVCISGIQHIDLIRQYRGAGIDLLYVRKGVPWMRPEDHANMLEGLRKAGWEG